MDKTIMEQLEAANAALAEKDAALAEMKAAADAQHAEFEKLAAAAEDAANAGKAVAEELGATKAALDIANARITELEAEAKSAEARAAEIAGHTRAPLEEPQGESKDDLLARVRAAQGNPAAMAEIVKGLSAAQMQSLFK